MATYKVCLVSFNPPWVIGGTELFLRKYTRLLARDGTDYVVVTLRQNRVDFRFFEVLHRFLLSILGTLKIIYYFGHLRFSIIHAQDTFYAGFSALIAAKLLRLSLIIHCHVDPFSYPKIETGLRGRFALSIKKMVLTHASKVIVVNENMKRALSLLGISEDSIVVIPMGVSSFRNEKKDKIDVRRELGIDNKAFVIGYCGRLSYEKGIHVLVKAFSEAYVHNEIPADSRLLIVGDGAERGHLESLAVRMKNADALIFTGLRTDVHRILSAMDVFVLPSFTEGSPLSLLEAMMAGKPTIASRIPAICEIIRHEYNGLLIEPGSEHALKETIVRLYSKRKLRRRLSIKARSYVTQHHDIESTSRRLLDIYGLVLSNQA